MRRVNKKILKELEKKCKKVQTTNATIVPYVYIILGRDHNHTISMAILNSHVRDLSLLVFHINRSKSNRFISESWVCRRILSISERIISVLLGLKHCVQPRSGSASTDQGATELHEIIFCHLHTLLLRDVRVFCSPRSWLDLIHLVIFALRCAAIA